MKHNYTNITKLLVVAVVFLLTMGTMAQGQLLFTENFNYTAGTNLTANGWSAHSGGGTNSEKVTSFGLTYTGYAGSGIGNAASFVATGEDVNKTWASHPSGVTSGSIYFGAMIRIDTARIATGNLGDYFIHFNKNNTTFTGRVFARRKASDPNKFSFGIAKSSTAANVAYSDSIYDVGTTYLVVVKYSFISGTSNDTCALWVNPVLGGSEPAPTVFELTSDKSTADIDTIYGMAIRQGAATQNASGIVDGIRVGTTWSSITALPGDANSDIVSAGNETSNIDYAAYQLASIGATTDAVRVWSFTVRDGGGSADGDSYGTELNSVTISKSGGSNPTWASTIRKAALFDGSTKVAEINVTGETMAFTGLSGANVTAADGGSKTLDLYLTFETTATDNSQYQFEITNANVSAAGSNSSTFTTFSAQSSSVTGDANRVEVTATKLAFTANPPGSVAQNVEFSATVTAQDANNNTDTDYATDFTVGVETGTGAVSSVAGLTKTPSSGVASWSDLKYNTAETGVVLNANSGSLAEGLSTSFDVVALSAASDIVAGPDSEPVSISSIVDTQGEEVQVFDITIRDGGGSADGDGVGTIVNTLTFTQGANNNVADWTGYIQGAELFDGVTNLGAGNVSATSLAFSGAPLVSTTDDGSKTLQLKIYLKSNLPAGADGKILQFKINQNSGATTSSSGSLFAGSGSDVNSGNTTISVSATELRFTGSIADQNSGVAFSTSVNATDANGSIDKDFDQFVGLAIGTGSGSLSGTTSVGASSGVATFSGVIITGTGSHTLIANQAGVTSDTSNAFNLTLPESPGVFKVANVAGDTLSWDNPSTWTVTSGHDVSGIPDANDNVILDNEFKSGSYVIKLGPTTRDTCKTLTIGYIGNSNKIEVYIEPANVLTSALFFGDGVAGNYDLDILAGGVLNNRSSIASGTNLFINGFSGPARDSIRVRTGGKLIHGTKAASSYIFRGSQMLNGDHGIFEYDVPDSNTTYLYATSGAWYPNLVMNSAAAGGKKGYKPTNSVGFGDLFVMGNLTVTAGTTDTVGNPFTEALELHGDLINYGNIMSISPSWTEFARQDDQQSIIGNPVTFYNGVRVYNPYNVDLQTNVTVAGGTASMSGGYLITAANTLYLDPAGSLDEDSGIVAGKVSATRTLSQSSNETFGNIGFDINALGSAPGVTTVERVTGTQLTGNGNNSIRRYFDVTTAGSAPFNATTGFFYNDSELNGNNESDMFQHSSDDGGTTWKGKTGTVSTSFNKVTTTNVNTLNNTRFTLASASAALYTTHTITMKKFEDNDGDLSTAGTSKKWYMELYEGSVAPENLINALNLSVVTTGNLPAGTYICKEADSTGWLHAGHIIDNGFTQDTITNTMSYDTITVSGGVAGTFEFYNSRTSGITVRKFRDLDGDVNTTGDQTAKAWGFSLYRDTVGGTPVGTGSGEVVTFSDLASGTYIAAEADSAGWFRAGGSTPYDTIKLGGNANDTITFYNVKANSLLVRKWLDADGDITTTGDQTPKSWYLEVRKGSPSGDYVFGGISSGILNNMLSDGMYYAIEADSGWVSLGFKINGQDVDGSAGQFIASSHLMDGQSDTIDFYNAPPAYGVMYRTFNPDSLALDKDNLGKTGKSVKAKADKVQFVVSVAAPSTGVDGLYAQFGVLIDTSRPFYTVPSSVITEVTKSKLTKFNFAFAAPLTAGDSVKIYGFGKKGSVQKVPAYNWTTTGSITGGKLKNPSIQNTLRLPMPNRINVLEETYAAGAFPGPDGKGGMVIGVNQANKDSAKKYGWVLLKKAADALKTLSVTSKGIVNLHDGTPRGFDTVGAGKSAKKFVGKYTSLQPTKQDNILFANLVALKVSIAASAAGKTQVGLGELILQDTAANPLNGMTIAEISAKADTMMTGYANRTFETAPTYANLSNTVRRILDAFEGAMDTTKFGGGTIATGTNRLVDCPILKANPSATPARIIANGDYVQTPEVFALRQNYPNPFNPTTTIQFDLPIVSTVTLKVYNLLGQEVATLLNKQELEEGTQELQFDASSLASGVYFYRITAESVNEDGLANTYTQVMKMLLMK